MAAEPLEAMRLDKWLWAAFLQNAGAGGGRDQPRPRARQRPAVKPAREVRPGTCCTSVRGCWNAVEVLKLSSMRGPAPIAQTLYVETESSRLKREAAAEARRLRPSPPPP